MYTVRFNFLTRLFILVSVLMIFSMSTMSAFLLKNLKVNMSEDFKERGVLLTKEFSQKIAEGIVIEDKTTLDKFMRQLLEYKDVLYVYIYSESGLLLSHKVIVKDLEDRLSLKPRVAEFKTEELDISGETRYSILDIQTPVIYDCDRIGSVQIGISLEKIRNEVDRRILNSSLLAVSFIIIGLVICFFFSRSLSRPFRQLMEGVKNIGQGNLYRHVNIRKKNEIGELAVAFNQMVDRLKESDDKLKKHAQELEKTVAERTSELKAINEQLHKDISQRRKVELALRESREQYKMLFSHLPAGVIHFDKKGIVIDLNNRFAEIMGVPSDKLIGFNILESSENEKLSNAVHDSINGELGYFEGSYVSVFSRDDLFLRVICQGILDDNGEFLAGVGLFEDMTAHRRSEKEKMQLQAQLQHAQKMEAIGTLAGGVAHDLNNILSGIISYPELILMDIPEDSPLQEPLLAVQNSGLKAAAIVQDLLTLARRGVSVTEVVNLNDILSEFLKSPEYKKILKYHSGITFDLNFEENLPNMSGSPVHLSKCVMNLISNAAEAMPDGGRISLSTRLQHLDRPVHGYNDIEKGSYVVFSIIDTGVGMSSEEVSRIFEPFYTKKVMGRSGTGLGMAVVWGSVKDHKGYIDIQSTKGEGSKFDLYFPASGAELGMSQSGSALNEMMGNEKIVVVDDDEQQRKISSLILKKLGYTVKTMPSGEDAVEYMKKNSADLLVLDMIMDPGIDGLETYKRILEYHPGQKAVIASGFSETERVREAQVLGVGAYIKKPYSMEEIGRAIRSELDA